MIVNWNFMANIEFVNIVNPILKIKSAFAFFIKQSWVKLHIVFHCFCWRQSWICNCFKKLWNVCIAESNWETNFKFNKFVTIELLRAEIFFGSYFKITNNRCLVISNSAYNVSHRAWTNPNKILIYFWHKFHSWRIICFKQKETFSFL